jgi:hypothetical protein
VHGQARRYFLGLLSFGVVAVWATSGLVTVVLALLASPSWSTVRAYSLSGRRRVHAIPGAAHAR